jgi:hypothetical protein
MREPTQEPTRVAPAQGAAAAAMHLLIEPVFFKEGCPAPIASAKNRKSVYRKFPPKPIQVNLQRQLVSTM